MSEMLTMGQRIKSRRIELGMTQKDLADKVGPGFAQNSVSRYEKGYRMKNGPLLYRIAEALDVSEEWLRNGGELQPFPKDSLPIDPVPKEAEGRLPKLSEKSRKKLISYIDYLIWEDRNQK